MAKFFSFVFTFLLFFASRQDINAQTNPECSKIIEAGGNQNDPYIEICFDANDYNGKYFIVRYVESENILEYPSLTKNELIYDLKYLYIDYNKIANRILSGNGDVIPSVPASLASSGTLYLLLLGSKFARAKSVPVASYLINRILAFYEKPGIFGKFVTLSLITSLAIMPSYYLYKELTNTILFSDEEAKIVTIVDTISISAKSILEHKNSENSNIPSEEEFFSKLEEMLVEPTDQNQVIAEETQEEKPKIINKELVIPTFDIQFTKNAFDLFYAEYKRPYVAINDIRNKKITVPVDILLP
jgi:hypothetical protein